MSTSFQSHRPAHLYRCFSATGDLLYIGVTVDHRGRFAKHEAKSDWWVNVDRIELAYFPARHLALDAERSAILAENPIHNVQRITRPIHRPTLVFLDEASEEAS